MEVLGPILILASLPLILRRVPPNRIYGFRIPATLRDKSVWYDANALSGRHFMLLGVLMVGLEFILPVATRHQVLRTIGVVGLVLITAKDWVTANRWERERSTSSKSN